ncbi:MAG: type II secretion system protein, partial [Candidatus Magasanikiibacteriota bacterium]
IVVAIMAIIASVVFVALNPLQRFQDSRDSVRWQQTSQILNAIKLYQVDHGGADLTAVSDLVAGNFYMIGTDDSNCDNNICDVEVTGDDFCVDLSGLVDSGYLSAMPISPNGEGDWDDGHTGYIISTTSTGAVFIQACESENSPEIVLSR